MHFGRICMFRMRSVVDVLKYFFYKRPCHAKFNLMLTCQTMIPQSAGKNDKLSGIKNNITKDSHFIRLNMTMHVTHCTVILTGKRNPTSKMFDKLLRRK